MAESGERPGGEARGAATGLRGWLSDILLPTLVESGGASERLTPLLSRLGSRATLDHPLFGRATGLPGTEMMVTRWAEWLVSHHARYKRLGLVVGIDRDVTEGTLTLNLDGKELSLPVAVVAERRKSREVELRVYHATRELRAEPPPVRAQLVPQDEDLSLPPMVTSAVEALRKGDVQALLACYEADAVVRDARGNEHRNADGGLRAFYERRFGVGSGGGADRARGGYADDGRTCALEFTLTRARGEVVEPQPGLAVYERGDTGLLRALRLYEEDAS